MIVIKMMMIVMTDMIIMIEMMIMVVGNKIVILVEHSDRNAGQRHQHGRRKRWEGLLRVLPSVQDVIVRQLVPVAAGINCGAIRAPTVALVSSRRAHSRRRSVAVLFRGARTIIAHTIACKR